MALTFTRLGYEDSFLPPYRLTPLDIVFDSSYASGGEVLGDGTSGVPSALVVGFQDWGIGTAAAAGYNIRFNTATGKLVAYKSGTGAAQVHSGADLKGATNLAGTEGAADQNATAVSGGLLYSGDTFTNLAGTLTPTRSPDIARNIVIQVENGTGGALNLYEGTTTYTITGTDINGNAQTETVAWVSTAGNKSIAASKFRYKQGTKAFATVTTVTWDNAPAGGLTLELGIGTRIGLPAALATGTYTDVTDLTVSAAYLAPSATAASAGGIDTTNNTFNSDTTANNWDFIITYNAIGAQVTSGVDLSGVTIRGALISRI